ncbi:MAG: ParB protein [Patescibacteria group bacterium]|nr:ParB protein [Patescibacteria group bacterium]
MNNKNGAPSRASQKVLRILSVRVTCDAKASSDKKDSKAVEFLQEFGFAKIGAVSNAPKYTQASTPELGDVASSTFVFLLEHRVPDGQNCGPFRLMRVFQGMCREIETGRTMLIQSRDGKKIGIMGIGDTIADWEFECEVLHPQKLKELLTPPPAEKEVVVRLDLAEPSAPASLSVPSMKKSSLSGLPDSAYVREYFKQPELPPSLPAAPSSPVELHEPVEVNPDEPMKHELALRAQSNPLFAAFVRKYCAEGEVLDYSAMKMSAVFAQWLIAQKANAQSLAESCGLDMLNVYGILRIKYLHPELQKLLAPPTPIKDMLYIVQAGELARIQEEKQVEVWNEARKFKGKDRIRLKIKELGMGHTIERVFSYAPPKAVRPPVVRRPFVSSETEFAKPETVRIIGLVCKVNDLTPGDLPKPSTYGSGFGPKVLRASRMLALIFAEKLKHPFAGEIFLKALGRKSIYDFHGILRTARAAYAADYRFMLVVDELVKVIKGEKREDELLLSATGESVELGLPAKITPPKLPTLSAKLDPAEQKVVELVCEECDISPADVPNFPNDDDELHIKIKKAHWMLCLVIHNELVWSDAKSIFLKIISKTDKDEFTSIYNLASKRFREDDDFKVAVQRVGRKAKELELIC